MFFFGLTGGLDFNYRKGSIKVPKGVVAKVRSEIKELFRSIESLGSPCSEVKYWKNGNTSYIRYGFECDEAPFVIYVVAREIENVGFVSEVETETIWW